MGVELKLCNHKNDALTHLAKLMTVVN